MPVDTGSDVSHRVLWAAKELFFAKGYAGTSLRAIASEAGTSESGVLRIYGSKAGLLRAVYATCWADINDRVDEALVVAEREDPDPRNLLFEVIRTVWQEYQRDPRKMIFMLSHFGFRDTSGLEETEGIDPAINKRVKDEYRRYLKRAHDLCAAMAESRPVLAEAGVTSSALAHMFVAIIFGIQTSWYMGDQEEQLLIPRVTLEEALAVARSFVYPDLLVEGPAIAEWA